MYKVNVYKASQLVKVGIYRGKEDAELCYLIERKKTGQTAEITYTITL